MESELVSGFMTEHSAVIFVFFFLAEYASIVLICITTCILFLGGYLLLNISEIGLLIYDINNFVFSYYWVGFYIEECMNYLISILFDVTYNESNWSWREFGYFHYSRVLHNPFVLILNYILNNPLLEGLFNSFILGLKTSVMVFTFIWVRASFPRVRFDSLMTYCWTILLPILIAFIIFIPFILYNFSIIPSNVITL